MNRQSLIQKSRVDVGSVHLLEPHPDGGVFDALGGLAQDVDLAALDLFGVSFDVVFREFDVFPLAARQGSGVTWPTVSAVSMPAISSVTARSVSVTSRTVDSRRSSNPRRSSPQASRIDVDAVDGRVVGVGECLERVRLRVCGRIGVGVGGDLAAVDRAVALARVVRARCRPRRPRAPTRR